jgi:long-chain acyl-CoA synthetase
VSGRLDPEQARELTERGMGVALVAREAPERPAILSPFGSCTFAELNARANRVARALRARGLRAGDSVALLCSNRPEFVEVYYAVIRSGLRLTPINWHFTGEEAGYVIDDCEARAFIADAPYAEVAREALESAPATKTRLAVGGPIEGFEGYDEVVDREPGHDLEDPVLGTTMLYTSGTTGRPKGVHRPPSPANPLLDGIQKIAEFRPDEDLALCTGPLYHAAPLALNLRVPIAGGVGVYLMDRWNNERAFFNDTATTEIYTHMVPTMFHRLLALPEETRAGYDVSSLRFIVHGAAPCPVDVKQRMMDWLGPIIYEYYAATEGGGTFIQPEEWLRKPGSVGRPNRGQEIEVRDDEGRALPAGEVGTIYFRAPKQGRFEYYHDEQKTASAYRGEFFTLRDMGYFDEDGYLFLSGRSAEVIISGGVNIYPAEVDAVLLRHETVGDVATIGAPNEEWGEEVKAVVMLHDGLEASESLANELIEFCREHLAHYKCPRTVDFVTELPRHDTGKIYRRLVRDRYWAGRSRSI